MGEQNHQRRTNCKQGQKPTFIAKMRLLKSAELIIFSPQQNRDLAKDILNSRISDRTIFKVLL